MAFSNMSAVLVYKYALFGLTFNSLVSPTSSYLQEVRLLLIPEFP